MKYLIFEDFGGKVIPILFPNRILHEEMREQIPYSRVIAGGYVLLKKGRFVCKGKVKELSVKAREEDSQIIEDCFMEEESF